MYSYLLLIFSLISFPIFSQTATLRGFVYEKETGEPVIFTNVYFQGTTIGASTDVNGFYNISKIPPGKYTLMVTYLGCDTVKDELFFKAGDMQSKKIYLTKSAIKLQVFELSAKKEEAKTEVQISVSKITPREMKQVPTIGGQPDLAQYLQVVPGIVFTGDQGGQLYIRGGAPIQNKVLLDGMVVYNPFHSIGLFSVFDMDIIRNAEIYTGGFNAQYGGRISSIMDITTRDGNKKRIAGKAALSPFGANLMLEGPIMKQKENSGSSISYLLSAKNSYLEQSSKYLYKYIDSSGLPFNFMDLYGKLSLNADNGSKVNLFGFNFRDSVKYQSISNFRWDAIGGGTNFVIVPGSSPTLIEGLFSYSNYKVSMKEKADQARTSSISGFNGGMNFTYFLGRDNIKYGVEVLGFKTDFNFYNSVNRQIQQLENTTEFAGFIKYKIVRDKFLVEPGFRVHYYASLNNFSPEPRLGIKFNITDWFRLKASGGLYSQNLISASSDRDVVNLFYGFLSGPDNLQENFDGKEVKTKLQKAYHIIGGFELTLFKKLELNVEGYYKGFTQLTNINRNKIYEDNADNSSKPDYWKKDFIIENGFAQGIDFSAKYDIKNIYIWAVYSLGYMRRFDGIVEYYPHFDRRHNVNLVGAYKFGKYKNWEFDARWNMGSGFPFKPTAGFYEKPDFSGGINTNLTESNGTLGILYSDADVSRLPYYHRLDITLKREFIITERTKLNAEVSVTNAYNRQNIFYFNRVKNERVDQLPVMPSISLTLSF